MKAAISIVRAGSQTLIVDRGRFGFRHEGLAWCGPADVLAYDAANAMLANDEEAAMLEIAFGNVEMGFNEDRAFALTGADCDALLDGMRCAPWATHLARRDSTLILRAPKRGVFSYLSIAGGLDVPTVLGSRTTDRVARIGGYEGRALRAGDGIALGALGSRVGSPFAVKPPQLRDTIRVISTGEVDALFSRTWRVGHESNRMGYRLHGTSLACGGAEVASHAVFPGVVQVPPQGEPIVLLCDAHTTGGYPKAGVVFDVDVRSVAQTRPGDELRFTSATVEEALAAAAQRVAYVKALRALALERTTG